MPDEDFKKMKKYFNSKLSSGFKLIIEIKSFKPESSSLKNN